MRSPQSEPYQGTKLERCLNIGHIAEQNQSTGHWKTCGQILLNINGNSFCADEKSRTPLWSTAGCRSKGEVHDPPNFLQDFLHDFFVGSARLSSSGQIKSDGRTRQKGWTGRPEAKATQAPHEPQASTCGQTQSQQDWVICEEASTAFKSFLKS